MTSPISNNQAPPQRLDKGQRQAEGGNARAVMAAPQQAAQPDQTGSIAAPDRADRGYAPRSNFAAPSITLAGPDQAQTLLGGLHAGITANPAAAAAAHGAINRLAVEAVLATPPGT